VTKDAVAKDWSGLLTTSGGRLYSDPANAPGGGGELLIQNAVTSLFSSTPEIQYPTNDASSQSHWRHRRCPAGIEWEIPLTARWGTFPYNWTITDGPEGLEIVNVGYDTLKPPYATSLRWTNPTTSGSPHTITLLCTDQLDATDSVTFSLEVAVATDTSKFRFVNSATGDNANTGTRASPWRTMAAWLQSDEDTSTFQTHQIFYEDGTYNIGGLTGDDGINNPEYNGSGVSIPINNNKPKTHVGLGSSVVWDSNGCMWNGEGGVTGWFIANIRFLAAEISGTTPFNMHFREAGGFEDGAAFKITFVGGANTTGDSQNASCALWGNTDVGNPYGNFIISQCTFEDIQYEVFAKLYNVYDFTMEGCVATGTMLQVVEPLHPKGLDLRRIIMRGCDFGRVSGFGASLIETQWINDPVRRDDFEVCWNSLRGSLQGWKAEGGDGGGYSNNHSYRNNWQVPNHLLQNSDATAFRFTRDIHQYTNNGPTGINESGTGSPTITDCSHATSGLLHATTNERVAANVGKGCQMDLA
jgi:hypothetical protein